MWMLVTMACVPSAALPWTYLMICRAEDDPFSLQDVRRCKPKDALTAIVCGLVPAAAILCIEPHFDAWEAAIAAIVLAMCACLMACEYHRPEGGLTGRAALHGIVWGSGVCAPVLVAFALQSHIRCMAAASVAYAQHILSP